MTPNMYDKKINNIYNILLESNMIETFTNFKPNPTTGWVYDNSELIRYLKEKTINDNHSDASFYMSCKLLQEQLLK